MCLLWKPPSSMTLKDHTACPGKKSKSKASRASSSAADSKAAPVKIAHDMDTLALFAKLKLPVPTTAAEVEDAQRTLEAKKAEYEAKQKRALAGEDVPEDIEEDEKPVKKAGGPKRGSGGKKGTVEVNMRCDEAFGMVLVELAAH